MKRFLVLQMIVLESDKGAEAMEEPVIDFDVFEEAVDWVNSQPNPNLYHIEDQFAKDEMDFEPFGSHDYDYYEMRDPEIFDDGEDFHSDDGLGSDGDGDAD